MERKRYEKLKSGSGRHGSKYEVDLVMYYLLNAYESETKFLLSHGNKDKPKWDDIVLETDTFVLFAQAKHISDKNRKISPNELFSKNKNIGLFIYLVSFWEYFVKLTNTVQQSTENLENKHQEVEESSEEYKRKLQPHFQATRWFNKKDNSYEENITALISHLRQLNDQTNVQKLQSFQHTALYLIVNISPNDKFNKFTRENIDTKLIKYFQTNEKYYSFNTEESARELMKLDEKSEIPRPFIEMFLKKLLLVIIPDSFLKENINKLLFKICKKLEVPSENIYSFLFELVEKWCSEREGIYLNREEVDTYFASFQNGIFMKDLKTLQHLIQFNIDALLCKTSENVVTIVRTSRSLLVLSMLQKKFEDEKVEQALFLNSFSNSYRHTFLINTFLHEKFTHFVCVLSKDDSELIRLFADISAQIKQNKKFSQYKKIILICERDTEVDPIGNRTVVDDFEWFREFQLNMDRKPNSLGDKEIYYINRELSRHFGSNSEKYSEDEFLEHVVGEVSNFFVISDSPGMGKTSILSSLAVKINKNNNFWAIVIRLNRYTGVLEKHLESGTLPQLEEFLEKPLENLSEKQIFKIPNVIILMVDAFDEIFPDYSSMITEFLENTRKLENVKSTIVTTRPHLREHLERKFGVKAYTLTPLFDDDVCSLISRFVNQRTIVVEKWYDSVPWRIQEFFSVPLHAKIFAESVEGVDSGFPPMNWEIDLYELYNIFIKKKKKIYITDKCNCQGNILSRKFLEQKFELFLNNCTLIALEMYFPKKILKQLGIKESFVNIPDEELGVTGILESCRFVHETLMEYFVANWALNRIFEGKSDLKSLEIIVKEILFENCSEITHQFIDANLRKNWNLITNDILETLGHITSNLICDQGVLWDISNNCPYIAKLMLEKCEDSITINKIFKVIIDKNESSSTDLVLLLIYKGAEINYTGEDCKTLLYLAVEEGNLELIKHLVDHMFNLDELADENSKTFHLAGNKNNFELLQMLMGRGITKETFQLPLRDCAQFSSIELFNFVVSKYENKLSHSYIALIYFHYAAYKGYIEVVQYISSANICDIHEKVFYGWNVLHSAARGGNLDVVRYLVSLNVKIGERTYDGETVLHYAVRSRNVELVKYFIDINVEIDAQTNCGKTALDISLDEHMTIYLLEMYTKLENVDASSVSNALYNAVKRGCNKLFEAIHSKFKYQFPLACRGLYYLHEAIRNNNVDLIKYMLSESVCNINDKTLDGRNILHFAVQCRNLEAVKYFVNLNVETEEKSFTGETLLHYASRNGDLILVEYIIGLNVRINDKTLSGESALHYAAGSGNFHLVKYLIELDMKIDEKTLNGDTVLHYAVLSGSLCLVKYLVSLNVKIDEKTSNGETVLHYAALRGNYQLVEYLIGLNMSIDEKTSSGETVLHHAAKSGNDYLVKYLIGLNIRVDEKTSSGETVLNYAARRGSYYLVKYLLGLKLKIDEKTSSGETILHYAVKSGNYALVKHLIDSKMKIHEKSSNGKTILHYAAERGSYYLVKYLVKLNMNIDEKTVCGETVLHYAARSGSLYLVKYLVGLNVKIHEKTSTGESVLHYAAQSGNYYLVKYLIGLNMKIDEKTRRGENVLHYAARSKSFHLVKYLVGLNARSEK